MLSPEKRQAITNLEMEIIRCERRISNIWKSIMSDAEKRTQVATIKNQITNIKSKISSIKNS